MNWYEEDVAAAIVERQKCKYKPETVFYGSSSFTLWKDIYLDFSELKPVNLGFGGSTFKACIRFFDRIIAPVENPTRFLMYAGDNDLGDGDHAHQVYNYYLEFKQLLRRQYGDIPFYYISIKPSLLRYGIIEKIRTTNQLIAEQIAKSGENDHFINIYPYMLDAKAHPDRRYFDHDGLHLNANGYDLWRQLILQKIADVEKIFVAGRGSQLAAAV